MVQRAGVKVDGGILDSHVASHFNNLLPIGQFLVILPKFFSLGAVILGVLGIFLLNRKKISLLFGGRVRLAA